MVAVHAKGVKVLPCLEFADLDQVIGVCCATKVEASLHPVNRWYIVLKRAQLCSCRLRPKSAVQALYGVGGVHDLRALDDHYRLGGILRYTAKHSTSRTAALITSFASYLMFSQSPMAAAGRITGILS